MKNQYFGDVRDLFKYDLIQLILEEVSSLQRRFTFIPMLTENDSKGGDGNKRDFVKAQERRRPGTKNKDLIKFLEPYKEIDRDKRDFTEIEMYFKSKSVEMLLYKEPEYFAHRLRDEYFRNIPQNLLHKSLVFVDPDIGLEIQNSTKKHLLYREVERLYHQMDESSILMIYQHFPRAQHKYPQYLPEGRSKELEKEIGDSPIYIDDKEIMFFLLTKSAELKSQIGMIINKYKRDYPECQAIKS